MSPSPAESGGPSSRTPLRSSPTSLLFFLQLLILPSLVIGLPNRLPRQSQKTAEGHALSAHQQPSAQFPSQQFAAQAFASKLAAPLVPEDHPSHSTNPKNVPAVGHQQKNVPQFVANNGPLVRTSGGQFVLASIGGQPGQLPASAVPQQVPAQFVHSQSQFQPVGFDPSRASPPPSPSSSSSSIPQPSADVLSSLNESSASLSTTSAPPPSPVDRSVDLDGDGVLSLSEVQYAAFVHHGLSSSVVENLFAEVDHNKDGYLDAHEFNDLRPLVLAKAENAALRYLQNVDTDRNGLLSLVEAQNYILKEYGISNRDVERIWRLVVPGNGEELDAVLFSKLRRRIRGMSIRLARQIMKGADRNDDGHIELREAQLIAFEQEGIGPGEVVEMLASVDDNNDGELNAPEFADFERIVRARAVETSKKALKVVDADGSGTLTMDEAKKIAFDHYGFDEATLEPFFAQADESEDAQLDAVEFAGFRSVIRGRAVKNAASSLPEMDEDGDGMISETEAEQRTRREDDMTAAETRGLFAVADQDKNGLLDKVELADFVRLVRLTTIKFVADHMQDYDANRDRLVTVDELEKLVRERYRLDETVTRRIFDGVDVDRSGDLNAGEIVDFRHEIRRFAQDKAAKADLEEQNRKEIVDIEHKLRTEAEERKVVEETELARKMEEGRNGTAITTAPPTITSTTVLALAPSSSSSSSLLPPAGQLLHLPSSFSPIQPAPPPSSSPSPAGAHSSSPAPSSSLPTSSLPSSTSSSPPSSSSSSVVPPLPSGTPSPIQHLPSSSLPPSLLSSSPPPSSIPPPHPSSPPPPLPPPSISSQQTQNGPLTAQTSGVTVNGSSGSALPISAGGIPTTTQPSADGGDLTAKKKRKRRRKTTTTTTTTTPEPEEGEEYEDDDEKDGGAGRRM